MSNPNYDPQDVSITSTTEIEEAAPRSYVAAGIVAALFIVLLCVLGVALFSSGSLSGRASPTPLPISLTRLEVIGGITPNTSFTIRGTNFAPNEKVELYVAYTAGASFNQFTKIGEVQTGTDGSFEVAGLTLPPNPTNSNVVYLLGRGSISGFSPVVPITIGGQPAVQPTTPIPSGATATLAPPTPTMPPATSTPPGPTFTPTPLTPTGSPTASPTPDPNAIGQWYGRYYDNPDLTDPPVFTRIDPNLNFNWKSGSPGPGIPDNYFSVRWTRNEDFRTTDNYIFTLTVDDGARVYVDNYLIINEWRNGGPRTVTANVGINKGVHVIRVEYYEATGNAQIALAWAVGYTGWVGRYYNTPDLSGPLVLKRNDVTPGDPFINFDWGFGSPAPQVNPDNFSVDWTRTVHFPIAGTYVFTANVDDGVRVFIDGNPTPVIDNFSSTGSHTIVGSVALSAGQHAMQVQYAERTGQAKIELSWAPEAVPPTSTPTVTLVPPSVTPGPPSVTPGPPSVTPVPPSVTPVPPSVTAVPPSVTPVPPSATPVPPSPTAIPPSATPVPPSPTVIPPSATVAPATATPTLTPTVSLTLTVVLTPL
jgi:hypothetical protein